MSQHRDADRRPLGVTVAIAGRGAPSPWLTVICVADNTFVGDQADPMAPALFLPLEQAPASVYLVAASFTRHRVLGPMFTIFGLAALFLAMVGLYAVMSFSVSHRNRELGIRVALGARGGHVVRMIVGRGPTSKQDAPFPASWGKVWCMGSSRAIKRSCACSRAKLDHMARNIGNHSRGGG